MRKIWNRKKEVFEIPPLFKSGAVKFLHENSFGRFLMQYIFSFPIINSIITFNKYVESSKKEIESFVKEFSIDMSEFSKSIDQYKSFAEFFTRELKKGAREINDDENAIISPCDGTIYVNEKISPDMRYQIKERNFSLNDLLRSSKTAKEYKNGSIAVIYLAPHDYHRFHYPLDVDIIGSEKKGNRLFSVSELSLKNGFFPFDNNVRTINFLHNEILGEFIMVEVGAFYVGRINQTSDGKGFNNRGEEKGYFGLGGSTIVLLFKENRVSFDDDIVQKSKDDIAVKIEMGEKIATIV